METKKNKINVLKLPYCSPGQSDAALDIFRRINPSNVSSKFVVDNNLTTSTNAFKIMDFWRWLGLVDVEGNVNEEISRKLKMVGEERDKFTVELIKKSYDKFFKNLNLMEVKKDDIINFIMHEYKIGPAAATAASKLFLHLCQKHNIAIADSLKKKIYQRQKGERKKSIPITKTESAQSFKESIPEGTFVLSIKGNGLNKSLPANNPEELEQIYNGKFKDFIEAAKLLFPERKSRVEEETEEES